MDIAQKISAEKAKIAELEQAISNIENRKWLFSNRHYQILEGALKHHQNLLKQYQHQSKEGK